MRDSPFVSVVIPAKNEAEFISESIGSLLTQDYPRDRYEIIVVDNGSHDKTATIAESYGVKVISAEKVKVGGVRNAGAKMGLGEIFAFMDADCLAGPQWISEGIRALSDKKAGAVGGSYLLRSEPSWVEKAWVVSNVPKEGITNALAGGSFIISRDLFLEIGGFDDSINAGEDRKLSQDVLNRGLSVVNRKECAVVHLGYPVTLREFSKRQLWHASSLLESKTGWSDKAFLSVIIYGTLFSLTFLFLVFGFFSCSFFSLIMLLILVFLFTFRRAKVLLTSSKRDVPLFVQSWFLDNLYFFSRLCGFTYSLFALGVSQWRRFARD